MMPSRTIELSRDNGGRSSAYLSVPESGAGPGLLIAYEIFGINQTIRDLADYFAEEGYVVLVPDLFWRVEPGLELPNDAAGVKKGLAVLHRFDVDRSIDDLGVAARRLGGLPECTGKVGIVGFSLGGKLAFLAAARAQVDVSVSFYGEGLSDVMSEANNISCPMIFHCAELDRNCPAEAVETIRAAMRGHETAEIYVYPGADAGFYSPDRDTFDKPSAMMAHTRTIAALRGAMGPKYDLGSLWDKHCEYEFLTRDVDATMGTMVGEPYVNHIPTMTGGVGYTQLHRFYLNHFVHANPEDTKLVPVSRTIGVDRVVDEMVFCFTHTKEIDWMLPGIPPTGKYVEVPLVAIVNFRGDKLFHEHIYWDQASVLVQIGILDPEHLPIAGHDATMKMMDASSQPSNTLMARWKESEATGAE